MTDEQTETEKELSTTKKEERELVKQGKNIDKLEKQDCPFCHTKNLTLMQSELEIPYFGLVYLFSMSCSNCKYHKSDVEAAEQKPHVKYTFDIESDKDMDVRVVKSSAATVKIPRLASITPGPASNGFVTNVEGVLERIKEQIEQVKENEEDSDAKKQAIKLIKKINRCKFGQEKLKLIIEDPTGNSAIVSDKAKKEKV